MTFLKWYGDDLVDRAFSIRIKRRRRPSVLAYCFSVFFFHSPNHDGPRRHREWPRQPAGPGPTYVHCPGPKRTSSPSRRASAAPARASCASLARQPALCRGPTASTCRRGRLLHLDRHQRGAKRLPPRNHARVLPVHDAGDVEVVVDEQVLAIVVDMLQEELLSRRLLA